LINPGWINIRPSHSAKPHRQATPPSHTAKPLRRATPPVHSAKPVRQMRPPNGVPVRERQALPGITGPRLDPCHRIGVRGSIRSGSASGQGTPPIHSANSLRQFTPPVHSASSLRQFTPPTDTAKRGAGQRAPSAAWDHSPMVGSVPSHWSTLINPGWINIQPRHSGQATPAKPLRPSHSGQATPAKPLRPSHSAKPLRQLTPPTDTAKRGAGQRAPSAAWDHSPPVGSVSSHRSTLIDPRRIGI
jgi:hypothetical protein